MGSRFLGWVGIIFLRVGERFIMFLIRFIDFVLYFIIFKVLCCNWVCDIVDFGCGVFNY